MRDTSPTETDPLFRALDLGALQLPNRVLMAPLTRSRAAQPGDVPTELNARYYAQRASAGLIFTEATQVSPQGKGYAYTPGIHSAEQVAGWREVTEAVHANGGRIALQLWHVGRMSHVDFHGGEAPVAPSAIDAGAHIFLGGETGFAPTSTPRALSREEIPGVVDQYARGAELAKQAGFDGVEIHGANAYLIHQFLADGSNHRDDDYGGSVTKRIRFAVEVAEAVAAVWGPERVGMRLSPGLGSIGGVSESELLPTYGALVTELSRVGLAYLDIVEYFGAPAERPAEPGEVHRLIRERFDGAYLANGGFLADSARRAIDSGRADGVLFGSTFLANPDLPERFRRGAALNAPQRETFFGGDAKGYTDYPALSWAE
ncbi:NADH-dependent flavin oxidoreductase, Oye family protein [Plesiocystis pacifica SIR-1]|uniref:NADH-dependent flavin oxidoreductase, Oye family protein n=1 Tax=Plesiocystis pacifica SIR-1 TaxID=391625 RepID=A6G2H2_9BACT|nr:alkene reductase [Plesiocystis pacifica]EDM79909.1 NADH-dependent flavin oxidoreductase, Oye family protein [Plesiocystis pacifica SIR-1]